MIARHYSLQAAADQAQAARDELAALAALVAACPGCLEASGFQVAGSEVELVFVERWDSEAAWAASKSHLPANAFAGLGKTLAAPPKVVVLQAI